MQVMFCILSITRITIVLSETPLGSDLEEAGLERPFVSHLLSSVGLSFVERV